MGNAIVTCHGPDVRAFSLSSADRRAIGGLLSALRYLGIAAILGLAITAAPLIVAILFAARPSASRLDMMRPISLAAIFSTLAGLFLSAANSLVGITRHVDDPNLTRYVAQVFAESAIPAFVSFALLTAAWLIVAIGMRRQAGGS
jgi:hypothetical protein